MTSVSPAADSSALSAVSLAVKVRVYQQADIADECFLCAHHRSTHISSFRLRVHFHVPIYLDSIGPLGTTNDQIAEAIAAAREYHDTKHFEVETYAWGVLPDDLKRDTLAEGIADELKWVLNTCGHIT